MNALYNIDLNIGVALMLVMLVLFAVGTLVYALGWLLVEKVRNGRTDWQPDCTVTETGVGVVESAERASELEAWAELVNIFDFGGLPDGKNDKS